MSIFQQFDVMTDSLSLLLRFISEWMVAGFCKAVVDTSELLWLMTRYCDTGPKHSNWLDRPTMLWWSVWVLTLLNGTLSISTLGHHGSYNLWHSFEVNFHSIATIEWLSWMNECNFSKITFCLNKVSHFQHFSSNGIPELWPKWLSFNSICWIESQSRYNLCSDDCAENILYL